MIDRGVSLDEITQSTSEAFGIHISPESQENAKQAILKAQAAANIIFRNPELGTEEIETSDLLARGLSKAIGRDNVFVLVKQDVGEPQIKNGIKTRRFLPRWGRPNTEWGKDESFHHDLKTDSEMGGVVGILEGDNPDGPTIFIMSDLDALPNGHHCGHNAHTAALIMDALILNEYKKASGYLPVNKVVFVGRVNEEGLAPNKTFSDAHEMADAGLFGIVGNNPDIILSTHVLPSLALGEIIIDKGPTTHGAGFFSVELSSQGNDLPLEVVASRIVCRVAQEWGSENPQYSVPRLIATESKGLNTVVRVTDRKDSPDKKVNTSLLKSNDSISVPIQPGQTESIARAWQEFTTLIEPWRRIGTTAAMEIVDNKLVVKMSAEGGHVGAGGANIEYLTAAAINYMDEQGVLWGRNETQKIDMVGTIRVKMKEWKSVGRNIVSTINRIVTDESEKEGVKGNSHGNVVVPPVINSPRLREISTNFLRNSFSSIFSFAKSRLLASYAEPLSFWQRLTKAETLLVWMGTESPSTVAGSRHKGARVPPQMQLHTNEMTVLKDKVPYLGILSLLCIKLGQEWQK